MAEQRLRRTRPFTDVVGVPGLVVITQCEVTVLDEAVSDETVGLTAGVQGLDQFLASQDDGSDGSDWD